MTTQQQTSRNQRSRASATVPLCCSGPGGLSKASRDYAHCLCHPGGYAGLDHVPGVPDGAHAFRYHTFARAGMVIGTGGVGWVAVDTNYMAWNSVSGGVAASHVASTGLVISKAQSNEYAATGPIAQPTSDASSTNGYFRLVGACVRVVYDGPLIDTEGHSVAFSFPVGTASGAQESELLSDPARSSRAPVRVGEWVCAMHPGGYVETRSEANDPNVVPMAISDGWFSYGGQLSGEAYTLGVMVVGVAGDSYIWSVDAVYEWMPMYSFGKSASSINALATMARTSPSDPVGAGAVRSMARRMPLTMRTKSEDGTGSLAGRLISGAESLLTAGVTVARNPTARRVATSTYHEIEHEIGRLARSAFGTAARSEGTLISAAEGLAAIAALQRVRLLQEEAADGDQSTAPSRGGARSATTPYRQAR